MKLFITRTLHIRGINIKIIEDDIKQVILFLAWTPNAKKRIILNNKRNKHESEKTISVP